jgi:hypothetical protein
MCGPSWAAPARRNGSRWDIAKMESAVGDPVVGPAVSCNLRERDYVFGQFYESDVFGSLPAAASSKLSGNPLQDRNLKKLNYAVPQTAAYDGY